MNKDKIRKIEDLKNRSIQNVGSLASDLIAAEPDQKELVLAEMDYHRSICEFCDLCLTG